MPARTPLPSELLLGPFTVGQARELSVSRGRLRNRELESPTRGVRLAAAGDRDPVGHALAFASVLPGDVAFSHLTAARLHGLPTPKPWPGTDELLDVMRVRHRPPVTRAGCRTHRGLESRDITLAHGLRVTSATDTWCDLAGLWSEAHLLAVADDLLRRGIVTQDLLLAAAAARVGRRHAGVLMPLARLARPGAASPGESLARWWFWTWALPEPELNVAVHDNLGQWLATVDFRWRAQRVVGEYDGDVHRTDRRDWQRNKQRRASLEDAGWAYVDMTALSFSDDHHRQQLRTRLRRLLSID
ncbi:MAG: hypothetical protein ACJ714_13525 [Ornithinibacter sp.]